MRVIRPSRFHWALFALFLIAMVVRFMTFAYVSSWNSQLFLQFDAWQYDHLAINLWTHGVFSQANEAPFTADIVRTPVYPLFLAAIYAAIGHATTAAVALQIVVVSLTAPLTAMLAEELRLPRVAGVGAGLVVALDPVSILYANLLMTDAVYTVLLLGGIWALVRAWRSGAWMWACVAGLCIALSSLTRPVGQFLPYALLLPGLLAIRQVPRHQLKRVAWTGMLFLLVNLICLSAWSYRNFHHTGAYTISTISSYNLLYWRAAKVVAAADGIPLDDVRAQFQVQIAQDIADGNLTLAEQSDLERKHAVEIFREHPRLTVQQTVGGAIHLLFAPPLGLACTMLDRNTTPAECGQGGSLAQLRSLSALPLVTTLWCLLLLLAVYVGAAIGVVSLWVTNRRMTLLFLVTIIVYFIALSSGGDTVNRMRLPFFPYVAILAGVGGWVVGSAVLPQYKRLWPRARSHDQPFIGASAAAHTTLLPRDASIKGTSASH